jgi:hypothetical protein
MADIIFARSTSIINILLLFLPKLKTPFQRDGDQAGFALILNEKDNKYESGVDLYYQFFINIYLNLAPNFQMYYTVSDRINTVFGLRAFISY